SALGQARPDLLVAHELTSVHPGAYLLAEGAKAGIPLEQEMDQVLIQADQGVTALVLEFESQAFGSRRFEAEFNDSPPSGCPKHGEVSTALPPRVTNRGAIASAVAGSWPTEASTRLMASSVTRVGAMMSSPIARPSSA